MTLIAKVKVTVTSSSKQAYNLAVLGARTLKGRKDVSSDQKVMVKVTMTFRTALSSGLFFEGC